MQKGHGNHRRGSADALSKGFIQSLCGEFQKHNQIDPAYYEKYGVSLFVGVGIPIPLLDEELAHDVSIRNEQITTNILDFGEEERPIGQTNYAELRSGSIEVRGQRVRTAPVASLRKAREIAETLKGWIARGEFLLTEPVQPMPAHSTVKGLKADDE